MAGRAENVRWDALQLGRAMARGRKLKAAFSDGKVDHLTTDKGFTHAWCVTGLKGAKPAEIIGWARSEALAQQATEHHARAVAKFWQDVKSEVVEIETPP